MHISWWQIHIWISEYTLSSTISHNNRTFFKKPVLFNILTLEVDASVWYFLVCRCLSPSRSRMSKIFPGSSSTFSVTRHRHSGQRSSCLVATIAFKQPLQNVCWQGRTLHVSFNRSKQTEQSMISSSWIVSMMLAPCETEYLFPTIKISLSFLYHESIPNKSF